MRFRVVLSNFQHWGLLAGAIWGRRRTGRADSASGSSPFHLAGLMGRALLTQPPLTPRAGDQGGRRDERAPQQPAEPRVASWPSQTAEPG